MLPLRLAFSVMLLKPGLKPILGFFSWNSLPLAELGAIRQSLISRGTRMLVYEMVPRRCAACNPPMPVADTPFMMPSVATRVTSMTARLDTSVPSSAC